MCRPSAVAIAKAKLASTTLSSVMALTEILLTSEERVHAPKGEFWNHAYHPSTLNDIARLRQGLLQSRDTAAARLLRALALGGLHGPLAKIRSIPVTFQTRCRGHILANRRTQWATGNHEN